MSKPRPSRLHNLSVFSICLLLSLATYFNYRINLNSSVNYVIPIEIKTPAGLILTYMETKEVKLTIRGRQTVLEAISATKMSAVVNLDNFQKGNWSVPVQINEKILQEKKISFTLQPTTVAVRLEELVSRQVPVEANLVGMPATGYILESYSITPERVTLRGPATTMANIRILKSEAIDLTGRSGNFQAKVMLQLPHPLLTVDPGNTVTYSVVLQEQTGVLTLSVPVTIENLPQQFQVIDLRPTAVGVTLQGGQLELASLGTGTENAVQAKTNAAIISEAGRYYLPLTISSPPLLTLLKVEPETVTLLIRRAESAMPTSPNSRTAPSQTPPVPN